MCVGKNGECRKAGSAVQRETCSAVWQRWGSEKVCE